MASSTQWYIELTFTSLLGIYYISTSILMFVQRKVSPVKEHSITMIAFSGIVGWLLTSTNYPLPHLVGLENYPCSLAYVALIFLVPVYRLPLLISCLDLYNNYLIAETLVKLGEEKKKALTQQINTLEATTMRLITLKRRSNPSSKLLVALVALVPMIIVGVIGLPITGDQYYPGHYGCWLNNLSDQATILMLIYCGVGSLYIVASLYTLEKLKAVTDVFHIKDEIKVVFRTQTTCLVLFLLAAFIIPVRNFFIHLGLDASMFISISVALSHYNTCVKPLLASFGIHLRCGKAQTLISSEEITLDDILHDEDGLKSFTKHLIREFSTENIEFWKEIETYRAESLLDSSLNQSKAQQIVNLYVKEGSDHWINLPSKVKKQLEDDVSSGNVSSTTFDKAQSEIVFLMNKDSFPRYKKGDLFQEALKALYEKHAKPSSTTGSLASTLKSRVQSVYQHSAKGPTPSSRGGGEMSKLSTVAADPSEFAE